MYINYQDNEVIDHLIFDKCEGVDVEKMPTFNVYQDEESFNVHFNSIFQYYGLEANTQGIIEIFYPLLYIDGYIAIHHFEDPFKQALYTDASFWRSM